jgi:hypothetical protein
VEGKFLSGSKEAVRRIGRVADVLTREIEKIEHPIGWLVAGLLFHRHVNIGCRVQPFQGDRKIGRFGENTAYRRIGLNVHDQYHRSSGDVSKTRRRRKCSRQFNEVIDVTYK